MSPIQTLKIWGIQRRQGRPKPYLARWSVDGQAHSKGFRTRAEADRFRSRLLIAQQDGEEFSRRAGLPMSWEPAAPTLSVYGWAKQWVAEEWNDWAPRTRDSEIEALARFLPLAVVDAATDPPGALRAHLLASLVPSVQLDERRRRQIDAASERWMGTWGLDLDDLDPGVLADIERRLGIGDSGQPLASNTARRFRRTAKTCVRRAVELKQLATDPWPPTPKGRNKRKARRQTRAIDVKRLPNPESMAALMEAMRNHQPASRMYQTMTAVAYYAGLRPSEVIMLRPAVLWLPAEGWGRIDLVEADDGYDDPAEPKTGPRTVPMPGILVTTLSEWIEAGSFSSGQQIFRTRNGRRPALSNWNRALKLAAAKTGSPPISVYDCRHACATTWLQAGVPLGEAALRLGHTVETLVGYYVGALQGDDAIANRRIDETLTSSVSGTDRL